MNVVVVESPAKAKTINKYLGPGYVVLASFGHVRDLPPKDGSVLPAEDFAMSWEVDGKAEGRLREIAKAVKSADRLILATDPDREGEAISWHISEELSRRKALGGKQVARVVFNEITKSAVLDAMQHPPEGNRELVGAYLARRAPGYLVGFTPSPLLLRTLPLTPSTLQQEASRKLGFSASHTMRVAQRLCEGVDLDGDTVGLITYMRTDSVQLSGEAIAASRRLITADYGDRYLPEKPRFYTTKAKNAQEAHEAIRPTDLFRRPRNMARHLDSDQRRLYELIWKRTIASQMARPDLHQAPLD